MLDNDPCNVKALFRRGVAYTKIGEVERALEDLADALEQSKDSNEISSIKRAIQDIRDL